MFVIVNKQGQYFSGFTYRGLGVMSPQWCREEPGDAGTGRIVHRAMLFLDGVPASTAADLDKTMKGGWKVLEFHGA